MNFVFRRKRFSQSLDYSLDYERESNNSLKLLLFVTLRKIRLGGRNINRLSIGCPTPKHRIALGPPNPPLISIAEETLDFRRSDISSDLWLLMPAFSLPKAPLYLTVELQRFWNALLPYLVLRTRKSQIPNSNFQLNSNVQ